MALLLGGLALLALISVICAALSMLAGKQPLRKANAGFADASLVALLGPVKGMAVILREPTMRS